MPTNVHLVKAMVFSSSHIWMWELNHKESWAPKTWCLWTVVLEKTLASLLDCKEIKQVNPKGNQSWIFIGKTDAKAEALILWLSMWSTSSLEKTLILGKIEGRKRRGRQRTRQLDGISDSMDMSWASSRRWWRTGKPGVLQFMGSQRLSDWTTMSKPNRSLCRGIPQLQGISPPESAVAQDDLFTVLKL